MFSCLFLKHKKYTPRKHTAALFLKLRSHAVRLLYYGHHAQKYLYQQLRTQVFMTTPSGSKHGQVNDLNLNISYWTSGLRSVIARTATKSPITRTTKSTKSITTTRTTLGRFLENSITYFRVPRKQEQPPSSTQAETEHKKLKGRQCVGCTCTSTRTR